jgi:hypothetical protein
MDPAPDRPSAAPVPRTGAGALAFAVAALLSSWNAIAAPFGLLVGLGAALLGWRALRSGQARRGLALAAVALGLAAVATSATVLVLTAGAVTGDLQGDEIVKGRTPAEAAAVLDEVARRTAPARDRARRELDEGTPGAAPRESAGHTAKSARDDKGLTGSPPRDVAGASRETK